MNRNPVRYYGQMQAIGNQIFGSKTGAPMQVKGMSLFWSNWTGPYWNKETVDRLVDEFQAEIVRAAYGIDNDGNPHRTSDEEMVREVVKHAIDRGIYVIIDWHSHGAHKNAEAAADFFGRMAREFGSHDHLIFELYNEPVDVSWPVIKRYAEQVIPAIREHSDNLIVVGTPRWSQNVDDASLDPMTNADNVAYALHFYAGTHKQNLRDKANTAMRNGLPLFVTEWGSVNADGNGDIDYESTKEWLQWMDEHRLSWANWAVNDKAETSSTFNPDGSLTETGKFLKELIRAHAMTAEWRQVR